MGKGSTLLLIQLGNPAKKRGCKIATVSMADGKIDLLAIQTNCVFLDALKGSVKLLKKLKV